MFCPALASVQPTNRCVDFLTRVRRMLCMLRVPKPTAAKLYGVEWCSFRITTHSPITVHVFFVLSWNLAAALYAVMEKNCGCLRYLPILKWEKSFCHQLFLLQIKKTLSKTYMMFSLFGFVIYKRYYFVIL